jgi:DNA gyrase/topoisomerase IV subunit A
MVKPKRTSAEVTAVAERKAALRRQADELEDQRMETLAGIEHEEKLNEEEEYRNVVRNLDDLDNAEDVVMEPAIDEVSELGMSEEDNMVKTMQVAPRISRKQPQVCF